MASEYSCRTSQPESGFGTRLKSPPVSVKMFYKGGELGLISLLIALHAALDVVKSGAFSYFPIVLLVLLLLVLGLWGAVVWAVVLSSTLSGVQVDEQRVWTDSSRVTLAVCSVGILVQIMLQM